MKCPKCNSTEILKILYGDFPIPEKDEKEVWYGGGIITDKDPNWHCKNCGHEWR